MSGPLGPGALVWGGYAGATPDAGLLGAVERGAVGGVVLFARNAPSRAAVVAATAALADAARRGGLPTPIIAVDEEGGAVARLGYRTAFPGAMALAATGDSTLVEHVALATARGLRADGIGVNLAPVCDVQSEPMNPVIGTRSFGDDPARVAALAAAWVRGSAGGGVASVAKHFPGHGAARRDSHTATVEVDADLGLLTRRDLAPFRAAFAAGAPAAMTAHVRYPALDPERIATLSPAILGRLLRGALGFAGVLISDDLAMAGAAAYGTPEEVAVRAVSAGVDALLVGAEAPRAEPCTWLARGVPPERLAEAIARVRTFRARFGVAAPSEEPSDASAAALARDAAARSLTLVGPALPRFTGPLRVVALGPAQPRPGPLGDPVARLADALRARFGERLRFAPEHAPDGPGPLVVCTWSARFDGTRAARAASLLDAADAHCALGSPYDAGLGRPLPTLLAYGDVPASLEALAAALAGALTPTGSSPVRLAVPFC